MRKINRQIVSALIVSEDNKLLMGMKDPNKGGVYSDCWHIPGGGVEEGEDKIEALKREVVEEVGIDIAPYDIKIVDNKGSRVSVKKLKDGVEVECHMQFNVFRVNIPNKYEKIAVKLNDDLVEYVWADISKLSDYQLTPPSVELFTRMGWLVK